MTCSGSNLPSWTQTWTLPPDQRVVKVLSALKPQNNLCGIWVLFRSVANAEVEDSGEWTSTLIQHDVSGSRLELERFMYVHILKVKNSCRVKNRGWGWNFGQKETPSGQKETASGRLVRKVGISALELEKQFQSLLFGTTNHSQVSQVSTVELLWCVPLVFWVWTALRNSLLINMTNTAT